MILYSRYTAKNVNGIQSLVESKHKIPFLKNDEIKKFFSLNSHWLGISVFDIGKFVDELLSNSKIIDEFDEKWVKGGINPLDKNSHVEFKLYDDRMNLKIKINDIYTEKRFLKMMQLSGVRWCNNDIISDTNDTELDNDGCEDFVMYFVENGILSVIDSQWTYNNTTSLPEKTLKDIERMEI